jgi:hypothetical protein
MGVEGTAIQRIRYGLTGLAIVFLMVVIGTIVSRSAEAPLDNQVNNIAEPPSDPLAELGVAPGPGAENEAVAAAKR